MADNELFGDRRRSREEEYFRRQEQELIEKLKQRAREEATRRKMAERTGVADEEVGRSNAVSGDASPAECSWSFTTAC